MTGLTNYSADNVLNNLTGQIPMPVTPSVFIALFTAVGTDAGTGFTEVSGGAYTRVQIAGNLTANASFTTSVATISFASVPSWIVSGMTVYDVTAAAALGTVQSTTGTSVTLTANAAHASSGAADVITFSAFPNGSGTAPSSVSNTATINFTQASANWGTVIAWALMDSSSSGNMLWWDFLGNYAWLPFDVPTTGSAQTWYVQNSYASNDPIVFTAEYGGTLPTASTGTFTSYTINYVASPSSTSIQVDTVSGPGTPTVLTAAGNGMVRKITQQSIPSGVTASFSTSSFSLTMS